VIDLEVEKKELKNENEKFVSEIENVKFLHEQEIAEIRQRTQKMMTEQREAAKKESSDEIEKYRGKLQEIEQSVRSLRKDRDDQHNKNKDLAAELSTLKSSILPAVHTEATRILQHAKKLAPEGYNEKCKTDSVVVPDGGSQFSPDNVLRHLRLSTDQIIGVIFELDSEKQRMAVKQRRVSDDRSSHDKAVMGLRKKLEEKDDELKEVAKRMQQWKLTTARSLAAKLEKKIAAELALRREEQQQNRNIENWLSNSQNTQKNGISPKMSPK